ncbi:MAG: host attachment protein [Rhizobiales bacterium]|nr:host attachment protein [Hyphomicrobiales bacterium]
MKNKITWILIADGARARILINKGYGSGLEPALDEEFIADNRPSNKLTSDRPGRTFDSSGQGRHAMETPTDPHRHEQQIFAQSLAHLLEEHRLKKSYEQLIIVAAPKTLGDLRAEFTKPVSDMIINTLDKDLTKVAIHDLPDHFVDFIRM